MKNVCATMQLAGTGLGKRVFIPSHVVAVAGECTTMMLAPSGGASIAWRR